uniref:NADH dehydrogenase subunit 4 n=1 Tax=Aonchotheca putorii TaxID=1647945 RepID=UPI00237B339B|nr:NADH dehydrogenase subunit 4 [Aonchotheca putorii]WBV76980.1 NADH dehydrogenase subunit 4 [Aonchotheca putorii]
MMTEKYLMSKQNMNIYFMMISSIVLLMWLNSGYFGSISKMMSSESMLCYMMMIMLILMFVFFFFYLSYFPKNFVMYIYIYIAILSMFFMTNSLMLFYITFELSIIPMFIIIVGWGNQPERMMATNYLVIYTMTFSLPLLLMITYMINNMNSTWINQINNNISNMFWFIMIIPFLVKMPVYMFHLWLPKAHVEAPVMGSMFLASILLKTGSFGLMKINDISPKMINNYIMTLSLMLAISSSLMCMIQTDMKKFVAYSSVAHMTMMISLMSMNSNFLFNGMIILMLSHAIISNIMFYLTGYTSNSSKSRVLLFQQNYINMIPMMWFMIMMVYFFNSSLPPSISMISEFMIFINSMLLWNGNIIMSMILFLLLMYYSIWFLSMFNYSKNNTTTYSWSSMTDLMMNIMHCLFYVIFWMNLNTIM